MRKTNVVFLLLILFVLSACGNRRSPGLTIATAANMQYAMDELTEAFTGSTGIACETVISSSGKLTAQIIEGAPYDIFVSADLKYPQELYKNGLTTGEPRVYAFGRLVLWGKDEGIEPAVERLNDPSVRHIALANPQTAPYGLAAMEVLRHYKLLDKVKHKLVFGESISQTNQFVFSNAAELGFTAKSVVLSPGAAKIGRWVELDTAAYAPIAQGVVAIKGRHEPHPGAEAFVEFLFSVEARRILYTFGYSQS